MEEVETLVDARELSASDRTRVHEALDELKLELKNGPALLTRARWLIRYAANAVSSRLCQGSEREEASRAIEKAMAEYEKIRQAVMVETGDDHLPDETESSDLSHDLTRSLRALGKGLALVAARLARSCGTGQKTLTALVENTPQKKNPPGAGSPSCGCKVGDQTRPPEGKEVKHPHGNLVIVPIFDRPQTSQDLANHLIRKTNDFKLVPAASRAKAWVQVACDRMELRVSEMKVGRGETGSHDVSLKLVKAPDAEVKRRIRLIQEAITLAGVNIRLILLDEKPVQTDTKKPTRRKSSEAGVDPAKDKAILDSLKNALSDLVGGM